MHRTALGEQECFLFKYQSYLWKRCYDPSDMILTQICHTLSPIVPPHVPPEQACKESVASCLCVRGFWPLARSAQEIRQRWICCSSWQNKPDCQHPHLHTVTRWKKEPPLLHWGRFLPIGVVLQQCHKDIWLFWWANQVLWFLWATRGIWDQRASA